MIYFCAQKNRREMVLQQTALNGIDYLEVVEVPGSPGCGTQLAVTFLNPATSLSLDKDQISITGGAPVQATGVTPATAQDPTVVTVTLDQTGDFSTYTFALVAGAGTTDPPDGIDPQLASVDFSFKAGCPSPADCQPVTCCPPAPVSPPDINYLAKDYNGFLQVMLDRLAVLTPGWTETHAADLGVALTEVLAYAADHLSYQQDAVSTEAYLGTARSRISLRRHARLVDYPISEGCNARTLVSVTVNGALTVPACTPFYPRVPGLGPAVAADDPVAAAAGGELAARLPEHAGRRPSPRAQLHGVLHLAGRRLLPAGRRHTGHPAVHAGYARARQHADLRGGPGAADRRPRGRRPHPPLRRPAYSPPPRPTDPLTNTAITQITWAAADALPFPLCISSTTDAEPRLPAAVWGQRRAREHRARRSRHLGAGEDLGTVPEAPAGAGRRLRGRCGTGTQAGAAAPLPRYYPGLAQSPLTFSVPYHGADSAAAFLAPGPAGAVPDITLAGTDGSTWLPQPDLLSFDGSSGSSCPRSSTTGRSSCASATTSTAWRLSQAWASPRPTGSATAAPATSAATRSPTWCCRPLLASAGTVTGVPNPLAAAGGIDPEDVQHIRQFAPFAYEQQKRCVTEADYGTAAAQVSGVSAARGTLRWTGSWYTAFASVEPAAALTPELIDGTTTELDMLRMMGTDIAVEQAVIVGLQIEMEICVDPAHFQGDVFQALMMVFITGNQRNGAPGLLNPASFTFGQTVYASPLVAAAQAVDGVRSATLTVFTRMDAPWVRRGGAGLPHHGAAGHPALRQRPGPSRSRHVHPAHGRWQMSNGTAPADGQPCGCCTGLTQQTPEVIANRPALSSITYRAGRYSTFNASMLAALSDPAFPALAALRTRDTTDFSIALLDAWAVALDILTFYQERFANEAYLRTAVDQRSVLELAGLVGYLPSPGVAASAALAFTLSSAPGSPDNVLIPAGSRVQSVPGPGQTAQIFETSADLTAVIGWNALAAQTTVPWQLAGADTSTWIAGTTNNINVGDALLFVQATGGQPVPDGVADFHYVTAVSTSPASGNTQLWWDGPLAGYFQAQQGADAVALFVFRKKAALYGVQAPSPQVLAGQYISFVPGYPQLITPPGAPSGTEVPPATWEYTNNFNDVNQISLDASYPGLEPPAPPAPGQPPNGPPQWAVFTNGSSAWFFQITGTAETSPDYYTLTAKTTQLTVALGGRLPSGGFQNVSKFGQSDALAAYVYDIVGDTPNVTAYVQSAPLTLASLPLTSWNQASDYPLQPGMLAPVSGSSVSVSGGQQIAPGQPVGVSGKCLRIQVPGRHLHARQPGRRLGRRGRAGVRDRQLPARHRPGDRELAVDGDDPERRGRDAECPGEFVHAVAGRER